ncbi:hypothetical protein [Aquisphaera insulae]|uniref:hypothetical protein n=1 Tax=Aquisphaera insulae TaxID=2712864 RepID=UPI0013EE1B86|nr:hypothetical protein [Aquisphaera insulae]
MRPKPEPIVGLDPDLFAIPKPRPWSDIRRPRLLVVLGVLGVLSLVLNATTRADDAPGRRRPVPPGVRPRVVLPQRVGPSIEVNPFLVKPREGIDDAMVIPSPRGIDDAMVVVPRGGLIASSRPR